MFQRYTARSGPPIKAKDMNARADGLEKLMAIACAPPLRLDRIGAGYVLSLDGRALGTTLVVPGKITAASRDRAGAWLPSEVRYTAVPLVAGPDPMNYIDVLPRYGRPVYMNEGRLHPCAVNDACLFVQERNDLGEVSWAFMVINEQIAAGPCGSTPPPGQSQSGMSPSSTFASRMIQSLASTFSLAHKSQMAAARLASMFELEVTSKIVVDTANNTSDIIDVGQCESGTLSFKLAQGVGTSVKLTVQGEVGYGTWQALPNNDAGQSPVVTGVTGSSELRNLKLDNIKRIRVIVDVASGTAGSAYDLTFYSKKRRT